MLGMTSLLWPYDVMVVFFFPHKLYILSCRSMPNRAMAIGRILPIADALVGNALAMCSKHWEILQFQCTDDTHCDTEEHEREREAAFLKQDNKIMRQFPHARSVHHCVREKRC